MKTLDTITADATPQTVDGTKASTTVDTAGKTGQLEMLGRLQIEVLRRLTAVVWFVVASFLLVAVAARWPNWWEWIAPEAAPARELSTLLLLTVSALSLLWLRADSDRRWLLLAGGFAGLAADERLALHERIRDRVLAPRDVGLPFVPWGEPGDVVLVVAAIVGLASLPLVKPLFEKRPLMRRWFAAGIALAAVAVGLDTLPIESYSLNAEIWLQTSEEIIELAAAAAFVSALLLVQSGSKLDEKASIQRSISPKALG